MTPKLQSLASRLLQVTTSIEGRAEQLIERLEKADQRSAEADGRAHGELDKIELAVRGVEDLVNRMSNGGPPLEHSAELPKVWPKE